MFPFPCPFPLSGVVSGLVRHRLQPCGIGAVRHVCHAVVSLCRRDISASVPAVGRTGLVVFQRKREKLLRRSAPLMPVAGGASVIVAPKVYLIP